MPPRGGSRRVDVRSRTYGIRYRGAMRPCRPMPGPVARPGRGWFAECSCHRRPLLTSVGGGDPLLKNEAGCIVPDGRSRWHTDGFLLPPKPTQRLFGRSESSDVVIDPGHRWSPFQEPVCSRAPCCGDDRSLRVLQAPFDPDRPWAHRRLCGPFKPRGAKSDGGVVSQRDHRPKRSPQIYPLCLELAALLSS